MATIREAAAVGAAVISCRSTGTASGSSSSTRASVAAAWYLAFRLRFDPTVPPYYHTLFTRTIWIVVLIQLAVFVLFGFYNRWWRYVSTRDMWGAVRGVTVACLVSEPRRLLRRPGAQVRLPRSVAIMDWLLLLAFVAGARMLARTLMERPTARGLVARGKEVIIVGAGDAGQLIVKEMLRSPSLGYTPIGLVDDDPRKKNLRLHGVRVLGTTDELPKILAREPPGRGADRDPVRVGRGAPADRRHRARGGRAR